jgi:PleD family two-component response regulator
MPSSGLRLAVWLIILSIGVAVMAPAIGGSPERLIANADASLYRAKELGRNAVIGATGQAGAA